PPPQQHHVDHFVGIFIEQVATATLLDSGPDIVIDILIPAQFLDYHVRLDIEPVGDVDLAFAGVSRGDHGSSHSSNAIGATNWPHLDFQGLADSEHCQPPPAQLLTTRHAAAVGEIDCRRRSASRTVPAAGVSGAHAHTGGKCATMGVLDITM